MWKDDSDKISDIYININKVAKFPTECPICGNNSAHLYMDIHNPRNRRGGLWTWCDECYVFSHDSIYVPEYWENSPLVEEEKLCAIPDYLNDIKDIIDTHVNTVLRNHLVEIEDCR